MLYPADVITSLTPTVLLLGIYALPCRLMRFMGSYIMPWRPLYLLWSCCCKTSSAMQGSPLHELDGVDLPQHLVCSCCTIWRFFCTCSAAAQPRLFPAGLPVSECGTTYTSCRRSAISAPRPLQSSCPPLSMRRGGLHRQSTPSCLKQLQGAG